MNDREFRNGRAAKRISQSDRDARIAVRGLSLAAKKAAAGTQAFGEALEDLEDTLPDHVAYQLSKGVPLDEIILDDEVAADPGGGSGHEEAPQA